VQGLVAFTTELLEGDECREGGAGWKLTTSGRYAHCRDYVEREAAAPAAQLQVVKVAAVTPRWNRGKPVDGTLFLMRAR
jgi:predicted TPR repeat methyltransferase